MKSTKYFENSWSIINHLQQLRISRSNKFNILLKNNFNLLFVMYFFQVAARRHPISNFFSQRPAEINSQQFRAPDSPKKSMETPESLHQAIHANPAGFYVRASANRPYGRKAYKDSQDHYQPSQGYHQKSGPVQPSHLVPKYPAPVHHAPAYSAPSHGNYPAPAYHGAPEHNAPKYSSPSHSAPKYSASVDHAPSHGSYGAPKHAAPAPEYSAGPVQPSHLVPKYPAPVHQAREYSAPSHGSNDAYKHPAPVYHGAAPALDAPKYSPSSHSAPKYPTPANHAPSHGSYDTPKNPIYNAAPSHPVYGGSAHKTPSHSADYVIPIPIELPPNPYCAACQQKPTYNPQQYKHSLKKRAADPLYEHQQLHVMPQVRIAF
jgi:hypothetical protein